MQSDQTQINYGNTGCVSACTAGVFLTILLNFVSELLSVFSDGRDDLRHRIQHQVVRRGLRTKDKIKLLFFKKTPSGQTSQK